MSPVYGTKPGSEMFGETRKKASDTNFHERTPFSVPLKGQNRARVFDSRARRRRPLSSVSLPFLFPSPFLFLSSAVSLCSSLFLPPSFFSLSFTPIRIQFHTELIDFLSPSFQSHNHVYQHVPLLFSSLHLLRFIFCSQFNECIHQQHNRRSSSNLFQSWM